jgi:predicted enzyme related to lactoylglutathione lyase
MAVGNRRAGGLTLLTRRCQEAPRSMAAPLSTAHRSIAMTTTPPTHAIDWFEIPVQDLDRAQAFYETLLGARLRREKIGPNTLAVFDYAEQGVGGCLIAGDDHRPGANGTLVYLGAGASLDAVLDRLAPAGGRVATPKTVLPGDMGCFAHIVDSEGNRVGLHAAR